MKPQSVRGTHDLFGEVLEKHNYIVGEARSLSANYGFSEIETPIFEFTEVFQRTLGEASDIVSKEMYTFTDRGGDSLTLRPEGTAPIARAFVSEGLSRQAPLKFFYQGPMFRYERPQKGRLRQFHQLGVEILGVPEPQADIECLSLADVFLRKIGLQGKYRLVINSLGDEDSRKSYTQELVAFLTTHRQDLSEESQKRLEKNPLRVLDSKSESDQALLQRAPRLGEFLSPLCQSHFLEVQRGLDQLKIAFEVDEKLVRGLDYYSHTVFEFRTDLIGAQDALLSGGRYDKLIAQMGGAPTPGIGFAAGIERLALLVEKTPKSEPVFSVVPLGEKAQWTALELSHELRGLGFRIEMAYSGNLSKRMKKADKVGSLGAILLGDDEISKGIATWKDLKTGEQQELNFKDLKAFLTQKVTES